jgi:hypothetical protein
MPELGAATNKEVMSRIGLLAPVRRYEDSFAEFSEPLFHASGCNLGNFAFTEALWRHFSPDVKIMTWDVAPGEARECCDVLVFAAANQLGAHIDLGGFADQLERIGLPLIAVGLGAQAERIDAPVALTPGTQRFARVLASLSPTGSPNIGVRGEFTLSVLDRLGLADRAVVTGCPSNFLNDSADLFPTLERGAAKPQIDRLCVAAGSRHFDASRALEARLAQLVGATCGGYVVQADLDMVRFARGESERIDAEERQGIGQFIAPGLSEEELAVWRLRHAMCFTDATSWMEAMRNFDFVVGARFHGVMLAIQAGTPGGVIAHDSRTAEMCKTMAIPVQPGRDIPRDLDLDDLRRLFPFDVGKYAATRERLRRNYVDLLRGCGVEPNMRLAGA